jgi:hypothetical protein
MVFEEIHWIQGMESIEEAIASIGFVEEWPRLGRNVSALFDADEDTIG